jgi:hypothetical protein
VFFFACPVGVQGRGWDTTPQKIFSAKNRVRVAFYGTRSIGRAFVVSGSRAAFCGLTQGPHGAALTGVLKMNVKAILRAYAMYLAFNAATKIIVRPIATSLNVPLITTIVS